MVVAELDGNENEALDLVPLVTNIVLEEHQLVVGIVVIADPGTVPINSRYASLKFKNQIKYLIILKCISGERSRGCI